MDYKYIYNEAGQKEAVIVPIGEWESLRKSEQKVKKAEKARLADMIGTAKGSFSTVQEIDDYIHKLRDEWDSCLPS